MELTKVNKKLARLDAVKRRADVRTRQRIKAAEDERQLKALEEAEATEATTDAKKGK